MLLIAPQVLGQTDSLELSKQALRKCDSLIALKQHELARDWWYTATAYYPYSLRQVKRSSTFRTLLFEEKRREIDVLLTYHTTDSMRYDYREYNVLKYINSDYPYAAEGLLVDAIQYAYDTVRVKSLISDLVQALPTDTIWLGWNSGVFQLTTDFKSDLSVFSRYRKQPQWYPKLGYYTGDSSWKEEQLYCRKDSSLFNGVLIFPMKPSYSHYIGYAKTLLPVVYYENGYPVCDTTFVFHEIDVYLMKADTMNAIVHQSLPARMGYSAPHYLEGFDTNWGKRKVRYYPQGQIMSEKKGDLENYFTVNYNISGDTISMEERSATEGDGYSLRKYNRDKKLVYLEEYRKNDSDAVKTSFKLNLDENGDTTFFAKTNLEEYRKNELDAARTYVELNLDENGDTTFFTRTIDLNKEGLSILPIDDSVVRSHWENDTLVNFLTPGILFLDVHFNIITESEYLRQYGASSNDHPEWDISPIDAVVVEGESYSLVAYPITDYRYNKKLQKKLNKKLDKLRKSLG